MTTVIDIDSAAFNGLAMAADWIQDLESSDSRLHKESVIEKALIAAKLGSASAQCFLYNCYQAYNPFYVFGVRQVPETTGLVDRPNPWPRFWALLESLRTRSVTGHAAREAIAEVSQLFDSEEWNGMCRRVIIKDLRCGISEKTLNKVLGKTDWRIPVFSCQLATDSNDHASKMKGQKRLEQKLDGVRVLAIVSGTVVNLYSRNGKPFHNFPHIEAAIAELIPRCDNLPPKFVLDGEIIGESFQQLMRQAQRKTDVDAADSVYAIFDYMTFNEFEEGFCNLPQWRRTLILESCKDKFESQSNCLRIMPGIDVDLDTTQGHDVLRRYADDAVAAGFEGIMIKDVAAPYECRRSSAWMKWKPVYDYDLRVVAVEEGTGKNVGRLGALVCEGIDQGKQIRVNVGSGFTDDERNDYWANQSTVIGQTVVIMCDAVTQNQDGGYSLRFPRFKTFRDDK
jgi:DNA ligase-1